MHHTPPTPHITQNKQPSPLKTDVNPSTQPFIPAAETQPVSSSPQQNIPKSANGEGVKCSKQQMRQKDECLCFHCNQPGHLKNIVQNCLTLPSAEPEDMHQLDAPTNHSETDLHVKLLKSPGINGRGPRIYHSSLIKIADVFTVQETIKQSC